MHVTQMYCNGCHGNEHPRRHGNDFVISLRLLNIVAIDFLHIE